MTYSKARMTPVDGQNPPNNTGVRMCAVNLICCNKVTNLKCRKSKEHRKFIKVSLFEFRHISLSWDKVPRYFWHPVNNSHQLCFKSKGDSNDNQKAYCARLLALQSSPDLRLGVGVGGNNISSGEGWVVQRLHFLLEVSDLGITGSLNSCSKLHNMVRLVNWW